LEYWSGGVLDEFLRKKMSKRELEQAWSGFRDFFFERIGQGCGHNGESEYRREEQKTVWLGEIKTIEEH
jgi:hypothetical protein